MAVAAPPGGGMKVDHRLMCTHCVMASKSVVSLMVLANY